MTRGLKKPGTERAAKGVFALCAFVSVLALGCILVFLLAGSLPFFHKVSPRSFLFGRLWKPAQQIYGVWPMVAASLMATGGALLLAVPTGVLTAVYLALLADAGARRVMLPVIRLLAGIPSIVFGLVGMMVLVPAVRAVFSLSAGATLLSASVLLAVMVLPTLVEGSYAALRQVPAMYVEGACALGATKERAVFTVALPPAKNGILVSIVLALGRAVGETTAVIMVAGNQARMPKGFLKGGRTLTGNIIMEMGYAADDHFLALIATGTVLFLLMLLVNVLLAMIQKKGGQA